MSGLAQLIIFLATLIPIGDAPKDHQVQIAATQQEQPARAMAAAPTMAPSLLPSVGRR